MKFSFEFMRNNLLIDTMNLKNLPNVSWRTVIRKYPAATLVGDRVFMFGNGGTSLVDFLSSDLFIYDIGNSEYL